MGGEIAILGGVDMDKLVRYSEEELRKYIRNLLNICMDGGRYAFGSGNTISNYVPIQNYIVMLDEAMKW